MMNRDRSITKVDESSSKSNSVLGRGGGFDSVSFTRGSNFEEGSSSSQSNVNNLQEHQRLMMLRSQGMHPPPAFNEHVNHMYNLEEEQRLMMLSYHRTMQRMPHTQHTDPSSSSNTVKARVYPPGSRFLPTDLGCVRVHLRNKVDMNKSGFITTLDLYKDDPWLLEHVHNDLFPRGEWYYFTPRNKRGTTSCNRTVRGIGDGTWKSTSGKEPIKDKDEKVQGYKQSLVYNKTNVNGKIEPTGWNMTEYCLYEENQDDLVLCRIKGNLEKKGFVEEVKTNVLSKQVQDHEEESGANGVEMRRLEEDHGDTTQQPQQQEQEAQVVYIPPHHEGHGLEVETVMTTTTTQNNDNNLMTMVQEDHGDATPQQQQEPQEQDAPVLFIPPDEGQDSRFETMWNIQNNFMAMLQLNHGHDTTQEQQQQEQDAPPVLVPPHEGQDSGFQRMMNNENNSMRTMMVQEDYGNATQQQQQEQDAPPVLVPPPHEGQDSGFERMMNNENNSMRTMMVQEDHGDATQQQQHEQDAPPVQVRPPHEGQDPVLEEMMNDENNFMTRGDEDQQYQWDDDSDLYLDVDEIFS